MSEDISPPKILTERELQCLTAISEGKSFALVAEELEISVPTVALHIKNARNKLAAKTSEQAVAIAFKSGLLK